MVGRDCKILQMITLILYPCPVYAELIQMVITIGANWSPLELEIEMRPCGADPAGDYHWSPLQLEIEKKDNAELILVVITI